MSVKKQNLNETILYPQVESKAWADMHGLSREARPCASCGLLQSPSIPIATKNWRGLFAPLHKCGERYQLRVCRNADPKKANEWEKLFLKLKSQLSKDSLPAHDNS
jgi:hypothetical protein